MLFPPSSPKTPQESHRMSHMSPFQNCANATRCLSFFSPLFSIPVPSLLLILRNFSSQMLQRIYLMQLTRLSHSKSRDALLLPPCLSHLTVLTSQFTHRRFIGSISLEIRWFDHLSPSTPRSIRNTSMLRTTPRGPTLTSSGHRTALGFSAQVEESV